MFSRAQSTILVKKTKKTIAIMSIRCYKTNVLLLLLLLLLLHPLLLLFLQNSCAILVLCLKSEIMDGFLVVKNGTKNNSITNDKIIDISAV